FLTLGFDTIASGKPVFINLPRKFITGEIPLPVDPGVVVLEILEDISADPDALKGAQELVRQGYTLALDDFVETPQNSAFIQHASYIKVDVLNLSNDELRRQTAALKRFKVPLLAEKVETQACFELCKQLGYQYFQGYFFSKPALMEGRELTTNQLAMLNILAKLQNPECNVEDLEQIIGNDVGLSYKLLKIINSSFYNVGKTVESIQHALILLGLNMLKKWVTLITLSSTPGKSSELLISALLRARHCESLAEKYKLKSDIAFTVGMFSLLDAIMDQPLPALLEKLPLTLEVKQALLEGKGELGALLKAVVAFQRGEWVAIDPRFTHDAAIQKAYDQALAWCGQVKDDLGM
ncbi:MAG TPA: HDOD domain-containing protein, partial [Candidatus Acidoferrum sp.]|nr:HDOD domain-containing protein [Candidatus Acidoferrum sp.]